MRALSPRVRRAVHVALLALAAVMLVLVTPAAAGPLHRERAGPKSEAARAADT